MLKIIEGVYQNGQIELSEIPDVGSVASKVLVTFLDPSKINADRLREYLEPRNGDSSLRIENTNPL